VFLFYLGNWCNRKELSFFVCVCFSLWHLSHSFHCLLLHIFLFSPHIFPAFHAKFWLSAVGLSFIFFRWQDELSQSHKTVAWESVCVCRLMCQYVTFALNCFQPAPFVDQSRRLRLETHLFHALDLLSPTSHAPHPFIYPSQTNIWHTYLCYIRGLYT